MAMAISGEIKLIVWLEYTEKPVIIHQCLERTQTRLARRAILVPRAQCHPKTREREGQHKGAMSYLD